MKLNKFRGIRSYEHGLFQIQKRNIKHPVAARGLIIIQHFNCSEVKTTMQKGTGMILIELLH